MYNDDRHTETSAELLDDARINATSEICIDRLRYYRDSFVCSSVIIQFYVTKCED